MICGLWVWGRCFWSMRIEKQRFKGIQRKKRTKRERGDSLFLLVLQLSCNAPLNFVILIYMRHSWIVQNNPLSPFYWNYFVWIPVVWVDFSIGEDTSPMQGSPNSKLLCTQMALDLCAMVLALWFYAPYQGWPHPTHPLFLNWYCRLKQYLTEIG